MALRTSLLAALAALLVLPASTVAAVPEPVLSGPSGWTTPTVGQAYALDASESFDLDGHDLVRFEWDFDGDGAWDADTGAVPGVSHTWTTRDHLDAHTNLLLRVTDAAGESSVLVVPLQITDEINSWFVFSPQLVNPGDTLALTAHTTPQDVSGLRTYTYEWDLDGDGAFEHSSGDSPGTTMVAPDALGKRVVGLRVTDDLGSVSAIRREIEVLPRHPSRDQLPWEAPVENLKTAPPPSDTAPVLTNEGPVEPAQAAPPAPAMADDGTRVRPLQLRRIQRNARYAVITVSGPIGYRFKVTISASAKVARRLGLGRRRVLYGRATGRIDDRGIGRVRVPWTRVGRRAFFMPRHVVDVKAQLLF
ncbi:MAG TPA: hypothetical protein VHF89_03215 [Solirubrobacteraceae bacterium]|nr:hypothetical protein [Solirubrobacteraceae bacterium]